MSCHTPLVSVIIPVYNVEKYLARCIESILRQTYTCLEVILVDDGSIDGSGEICDKYEKIDTRVRVLHQTNCGVSSARNLGLDIASGEYIFFADSDDYLPQDAVEKLYLSAKLYNADCTAGGFVKSSEEGEMIAEFVSGEKVEFSGKQALHMHYKGENQKISFVYTWGKLYRRAVFKDIRFKEGIHYEDIHFMPYVLLKCNKVVYIPEVVYNYIFHQESISNNDTYSRKRYLDSFEIWEEHLEFYKNNDFPELTDRVKCLIMEKVFCHDINGTIPPGLEKWSRDKFNSYFVNLLDSSINLTIKLRFLLYKIIGGKNYRLIKGLWKRQ